MKEFSKWLITDNKRRISDFLWNSLGVGIYSGQAAILLIVVSRIASQEVAGMVSIGYAVANLFASVGKFGVRNYQVTDLGDSLFFTDFLLARIITVSLALLFSILYLSFFSISGSYSLEKSLLVFEIVILKLIDAFADVYYGRFQQEHRFQIGAKIFAVHQIIVTITICLFAFITRKLLISFSIGIIISITVLVCLLSKAPLITNLKDSHLFGIRKIIKQCFPLCVGTTLAFYLGNAPKYSIDLYLSEEMQAIFGYLMLPVFMVTLLNQFVYQPLVKDLGDSWSSKDYKRFVGLILKQCLFVTLVSFMILVLGLLIGLPVLSALYNVNLVQYRMIFLLLLVGGGIYSLAYYLTIPITTIRMQRSIAFTYLIVSVFSFGIQKYLVSNYELIGAAQLYIAINSIVLFCFVVIIIYTITKKQEEK